MSTTTILCVDDERNVLLTLRNQLSRHFPSYEIEIAESADEALELLDELGAAGVEVPLVIADQIMPGMKGDTFLIQLHDRYPHMLKVMLTGQASADDVGNVVNRGSLYRFMAKPWNEIDLTLTVTEALRSYQRELQLAQQQRALEQANRDLSALNADLEHQVQERTQRLQEQAEILNLFYEASPLLMGIVELSENDILHISHNPAASTFFGLSSEAPGRKWASELGVAPDHLQLWMSHYRQSQQQQKPVCFEYEHRTETRTRWLSVTVQFIGIAACQRPQFSYMVQDISVRKRLDIERQQAEQTNRELKLLEAIMENILAGYWDWNIPNHQEYLSPSFKQMFGYADHELPNTPDTWQQLILPEDLPTVLDCFDRHIQSRGEVPYYSEVRYRHKNGAIVWVICSGQVIEWDEAGNPLRMIGCHIDITERKRIEQQLQISERRYATLTEVVPVGIFRFDASGECMYVNRHWCEMTGRPAEAAYGYGWVKALHAEDRERIPAEWLAAYHQGGNYHGEGRYLRPDGSVIWFDCQVRPETNADGETVGFIGSLTDISDRKQTEAALKKREADLVAAQRLARVGNWEFALETQTVSWSEELFHLYGRDVTQWSPTYHEFREQVPPDDWELFEQAIQQAITVGTPYTIEHRVIRPDGDIRYAISKGEAVFNDHGQVIKLFGTTQDITPQKKLEIALQSLLAGTASVTGEEFFPVLVQQIAKAVQCSHVLVSQRRGDRLETLAWYADGQLQDQFAYPMAHTPCEVAIQQGNYSFCSGVQEAFPRDPELVTMGVDSYLGVALRDRAGQAIGVLCALSRQPIQNQSFAQMLLQIFGARAAAELERQQATVALRRLNKELQLRAQ
jgi:PAS domain S-box-containing protein